MRGKVLHLHPANAARRLHLTRFQIEIIVHRFVPNFDKSLPTLLNQSE